MVSHMNLNHARLPISPHPHSLCIIMYFSVFRNCFRLSCCEKAFRTFYAHLPQNNLQIVIDISVQKEYTCRATNVGVSPSGKATDSDSVTRRFESCYPSHTGDSLLGRQRTSGFSSAFFFVFPFLLSPFVFGQSRTVRNNVAFRVASLTFCCAKTRILLP